MPAPRASVIVATHDRGSVVGRAVTSALAQTVHDLEVIVVDDCSSDDTPEVLSGLSAADPRVRVVRLGPGEGGSAARARNAGLDAAVSPVVAFLDDDDAWLPTKLDRQLQVLDRSPEVLLVGCHLNIVREGREPVVMRGPDSFDRRELLWVNHLHGASCVALRVGDPRVADLRFDEAYPAIEDWDLYARVAALGGVARVPEVLVRYHDHAGARLTTGGGHLEGHRLFLERHGARMTDACRSYHRARLRLLASVGATGNLRLVPALLRSTPPSVTSLLAREIVAANVGARAGDPGRGHRALHAALSRRPSLLG